MRTLLASLGVGVALTVSASARAESLPEKIPQLIEESGWLRAHYPGVPEEPATSSHPVEADHPEPSTPHALLGSNLHVSLLARDWRAAYAVTSGRTLLLDRVRLIRSSRMAVTRLSAEGGKFLPYVEVSFGEWRADSTLLPYLHAADELAGQVAAGFEIAIANRCAFAWDFEHTTARRDASDPQNLPIVNVVASFAALRAEF